MYLEQKSVRKTFPVSVFGVELKKIEFVAFKVSKTTFFSISTIFVFRRFFERLGSYRAETFTTDRSRAPGYFVRMHVGGQRGQKH